MIAAGGHGDDRRARPTREGAGSLQISECARSGDQCGVAVTAQLGVAPGQKCVFPARRTYFSTRGQELKSATFKVVLRLRLRATCHQAPLR